MLSPLICVTCDAFNVPRHFYFSYVSSNVKCVTCVQGNGRDDVPPGRDEERYAAHLQHEPLPGPPPRLPGGGHTPGDHHIQVQCQTIKVYSVYRHCVRELVYTLYSTVRFTILPN